MDSKKDRPFFTFKAVDTTSRALIHSWMVQEHVKEWIHGECLQRTLEDLDAFLRGPSSYQHWLSYDGDIPFGYLLTSEVKRDGEDEYACFCRKEDGAITLDVLIGNPQYLGKGLGHRMIQEFLLSKFSTVHEVLIDPEVMNRRAIHVYEKAGFSIVDEFVPPHSTLPHYMMHLDMDKLRRMARRFAAQFHSSNLTRSQNPDNLEFSSK